LAPVSADNRFACKPLTDKGVWRSVSVLVRDPGKFPCISLLKQGPPPARAKKRFANSRQWDTQSDMISDRDRTALAPVFWLAMGLAAVTAAAAILTRRDLVYDGSHYLLGALAGQNFALVEPARHATQMLQQCFAVLGSRLGIRDLWTLGLLFSLGCSGWPVVLTVLCWFVLPRGDKSWIAGPLLNLVFAVPATNFIGIGEGIIASCLLWLALLLIEFRSWSPLGALACMLAAAACAFSHEAAVLCLLVLALAAGMRVSGAKGFCRVSLFLTAAIALAGAGNMARWIVVPRSAVERGDFFVSLLGGFIGTSLAPNIPALASAVAAAGCIAALLWKGTRARTAAIAAIAIVAILFVALAADPGQLVAPSRYFAARGLPVILTTLLAVVFLSLRHRGSTPAPFATPPVLAIVLSLAVAQAGTQLVMTAQWASYVSALRGLVRTTTGVVTYATAMKRLDPDGARFRRELLAHWSVEPLSILLAPQGRVRALVEASPQARWVPYDPANPATLPHAPGLDFSSFAPRPVK
jgi:hypothetical protein